MKGIILAAGKGTRLGPATLGIGNHGYGVSKPLITAYDKPTVYYPLADLISAGIDDVLVIVAPDNKISAEAMLGDGSDLGIRISYAVQEVPRGIAEAFIIAKDFIGDDSVALTLGDNIFSGNKFTESLKSCTDPVGATIFAYLVTNPEAFGVVEFDRRTKRAISLEEKPAKPKSKYAVPGMYFYDNSVIEIAEHLEPSARLELEITDVNAEYLKRGKLSVKTLDVDTNWFDTGTEDSLLEAAKFVQDFQHRHQRLLGSPEAAAFKAGFIDTEQLLTLAEPLKKSTYGSALIRLANDEW